MSKLIDDNYTKYGYAWGREVRFSVWFAAVLCVVLLTGCGKPSPVGKWQQSDGSTTEFLDDGTVIATDPALHGTSLAGKWSRAANDKILIQISMLGATAAVYAHFDGDNLVIEDEHHNVLHRISSVQNTSTDQATYAASNSQPSTASKQPSPINSACGYVLSPAIYQKWQAEKRTTSIGCPVMADADAAVSARGTTGRWVRLIGGDGNFLIMHTNGPHAGSVYRVQGCIFMLYDKLGGTRSVLGFPTSDEHSAPGGLQVEFEGGSVYWSAATHQCNVVQR